MTGVQCFLGGLGVGIATGLLLAPKSGDETRAVLKERASDGTDYVLRQGTEVTNAVRDTIERGRSRSKLRPVAWRTHSRMGEPFCGAEPVSGRGAGDATAGPRAPPPRQQLCEPR